MVNKSRGDRTEFLRISWSYFLHFLGEREQDSYLQMRRVVRDGDERGQ